MRGRGRGRGGGGGGRARGGSSGRRAAGDGWIRRRSSRAPTPAVPTRRGGRKRAAPWSSSMATSSKKTRLEVEKKVVSVEEVRAWTMADETAGDVFDRVPVSDTWARRRRQVGGGDRRHPPLLVLPPLNRVQLRPGHVLEIAGPSGSGKTEMLIQAAVMCILPTRLGGITYGGSQGIVVMFDLDGRFDMVRLMSVLQAKINDAHANSSSMKTATLLEQQKNAVCMASLKRFYRLQCSKNFEFLSALKTFRTQVQNIAEEHHGNTVQLVLIDGIGVFYWLDWVSSCAASLTGRKSLGVQRFSELIVRELRRLRNSKLFLVLATKSLLYGPPKKGFWSRRATRKRPPYSSYEGNTSQSPGRIEYREHMPAAWRRFVTHRLLLGEPLASGMTGQPRIFTAQWDKPFITEQDQFMIQDHGVLLINSSTK